MTEIDQLAMPQRLALLLWHLERRHLRGPKACDLDAVADGLGVKSETVERDVRTLRSLGFQIEVEARGVERGRPFRILFAFGEETLKRQEAALIVAVSSKRWVTRDDVARRLGLGRHEVKSHLQMAARFAGLELEERSVKGGSFRLVEPKAKPEAPQLAGTLARIVEEAPDGLLRWGVLYPAWLRGNAKQAEPLKKALSWLVDRDILQAVGDGYYRAGRQFITSVDL